MQCTHCIVYTLNIMQIDKQTTQRIKECEILHTYRPLFDVSKMVRGPFCPKITNIADQNNNTVVSLFLSQKLPRAQTEFTMQHN